ncbi:MAG: hypothetical protein EHM78_22985 [Myxococcaceae bacterium]|nr:MAG: hypothetical protein EHM78_22985 [Myxococcaceae bacterium]
MLPPPSAARLAALVLVLAAAPASARIAVLPLSGPRNHTLERQLSSSICAKVGCVPASTVMTGKKVDWDKVRRARLEGVVVGGLSKATRPQVLEVSFLTPDGQRAWRERYTVVSGRLSSSTLAQIRDAVASAARQPTATPAPPAPKPAAPAAAAPFPGQPPPAGEIAPPPPGEIAPPPPGADLPPPAAGAAAGLAGSPRPDLVELEIAAQLLHRSWTYSNHDPAGGLRTYTLSLFTEPRARFGVYPLRTAEGLFASAGLELSGAVAVGARVAGEDPAAPTFPLSLWWLDAGLRARLRLGSWMLGPGLGFRLSHQSVNPNSAGVRLDGIPTVDAKAVRIGLEFGGPIAGPFGLTGELSYLLVLSTGLDTAFPEQSAGAAFEGRLGVTWELSHLLRLFLEGTFSQESYNLNAPGSADAATASTFGGELGFRMGF